MIKGVVCASYMGIFLILKVSLFEMQQLAMLCLSIKAFFVHHHMIIHISALNNNVAIRSLHNILSLYSLFYKYIVNDIHFSVQTRTVCQTSEVMSQNLNWITWQLSQLELGMESSMLRMDCGNSDRWRTQLAYGLCDVFSLWSGTMFLFLIIAQG